MGENSKKTLKECENLWQSEKKRSDDFALKLLPRFGSVRLRFGDGTVQAVPVFGSGGSSAKGFSVFQCSLTGKGGSGFGSWKTVPAVAVPLSVSGKTVLTVPVSQAGYACDYQNKRLPIAIHELKDRGG